MRICEENGHGEIVYEERNCPACSQIAELEDIINELKDSIKELEVEITAFKEAEYRRK